MREKTTDPYFKVICILIFSKKSNLKFLSINEDTEWMEYIEDNDRHYVRGLWEVFKNGRSPSEYAKDALDYADISALDYPVVFKRSTFYNHIKKFKLHMNYFDLLRKLNAEDTELLEMMVSGGALHKASVDRIDEKRWVWDLADDA